MCAQIYKEGNRNNQYSFDDYLFVRNHFNYYSDDEFFQILVNKYTGNEFEKLDKELRALSDYVSFRFRDFEGELRLFCQRKIVGRFFR